MRTNTNAGHDHAIIGRQTTVDGNPPHSHAIEVASNQTSFNGTPPHRHTIVGKSDTEKKSPTGPRPPKY